MGRTKGEGDVLIQGCVLKPKILQNVFIQLKMILKLLIAKLISCDFPGDVAEASE